MELRMNSEGKIVVYKEPYTMIEIDSEEDYERLQYLLKLGAATESAFEEWPYLESAYYLDGDIDEMFSIVFESVQDLLKWAER